MLKDINTLFKNFDGSIATENGKEISMKDIIIDVLMDSNSDDHELSSTEKLDRYTLAMRCKEGGHVEFLPEEAVLLRKLVGKKFPPIVVGQFFNFFN